MALYISAVEVLPPIFKDCIGPWQGEFKHVLVMLISALRGEGPFSSRFGFDVKHLWLCVPSHVGHLGADSAQLCQGTALTGAPHTSADLAGKERAVNCPHGPRHHFLAQFKF